MVINPPIEIIAKFSDAYKKEIDNIVKGLREE